MATANVVESVILDDIDPRLRAFRYGRLVDSFAVVTRRFVVLIDTMVNPECAEQIVGRLQDELRNRTLLVVNTHADWDHALGNGLFAGERASFPAPIIAHRIAAERLRSREAAEQLDEMRREHPAEFGSARNVAPTITFDGNLVIDGGDLTVHLLHTPGHQPDHIAIWIPEIAQLIAGDAAELPVPYVAHWETLPELRESLRHMENLGAQRVLYCHAQDITDPALIGHNREYFDELESRCAAVLATGTMPDDVEQLDDPARAVGWPFEDALPPIESLDEQPDPDGHNQAIKAMLRWLRSTGAR